MSFEPIEDATSYTVDNASSDPLNLNRHEYTTGADYYSTVKRTGDIPDTVRIRINLALFVFDGMVLNGFKYDFLMLRMCRQLHGILVKTANVVNMIPTTQVSDSMQTYMRELFNIAHRAALMILTVRSERVFKPLEVIAFTTDALDLITAFRRVYYCNEEPDFP